MSKNKEKESTEIIPVEYHSLLKRSTSSLVQRGLEKLKLEQYSEIIRLLIVDDIVEMRDNIRKLIRFESDIEVVGEASNGEEAIELYEKLRPDVVSMNINMPVMDGITATNIICRKFVDAKVFILSVQSDADNMRRAMEAGARDFIAKPPSGDELINTIRSLSQYRSKKSKRNSEANPDVYEVQLTKLIQRGLLSTKHGDSIREEAKSIALSALRELTGTNKGELIKFLCKTGLINKGDPIVDLRGADLSWISVLNGGLLQATDFSNTNLQNALFESVDFSNVNLQGADLEKAIFYKTNLSSANLANSNLSFVRTYSCIIHKASLNNCDLHNAVLSNSDLRQSVLRGSILSGCRLFHSNLSETDFRGARIDHAWMIYADLSRANLKKLNLRFAHFINTNLSGADLSEAILINVNLNNENLSDADLSNANLSGSNLDGANFTNAIVTSDQLLRAGSLKGTIFPDGSTHR